MSSFWQDLKLKQLEKKNNKEGDLSLDQARYLAVTTGRIDPYLRQLSTSPVFTFRPVPVTKADSISFLHVWASSVRAQKAALEKLGKIPAILEVAGESFALNWPTCPTGIVIDPGLETELTIEPHQLSIIADLRGGKAPQAAFSPVATERLTASAPALANIPAPLKEQARQVSLVRLEGHGCQDYWFVTGEVAPAPFVVNFQDVTDPALKELLADSSVWSDLY